ncbi:MAG: hypothetical protein COA63_002445 [Methylophaga sp.]|nr:hypothetical protein [Methylophaga sp.]
MDNAVALVQAYLHLNGYFTVTEFPVIEAMGKSRGHRVATDLDVLAFRFPHAGHDVTDHHKEKAFYAPDPALNCPANHADMLVGEVKEGHAELNRGATNPFVLRSMLVRFGCCSQHDAGPLIHQLISRGKVTAPSGHNIRLVAFGSASLNTKNKRYEVIDLGHIVQFLQNYIHEHWHIFSLTQSKDPALGFLLLLEKALRGVTQNER